MKRSAILSAIAGLLLAIALIARQGFAPVAQAVADTGWGVLAVTLFHLVPVALSAYAWLALLEPADWPTFRLLAWARWVREAVDNLLPVAQVGGVLVGARLITFRGIRAGTAGASGVVDMTMEVLAQFVFTLIGFGLLLLRGGGGDVVRWVAVGLAVAAPALIGFLAAQHLGMFRLLERGLERLAEKWPWLSPGQVTGMHDQVRALYRERRRLADSAFRHLVSWISGAVEIWLALRFMGHGVDMLDALLLESLAHAIRSAAFFVPGALGVQEGGLMLLAGVLGLGPEIGLALSLIKRVRDVVLGLPALLAWQMIEGRRALAGQEV